MRFEIEEGKSTREQWRTLVYRSGGEEMSLHVFIPDSAEWNSFVSKYGLFSVRADFAGAQAFVARKWFDNFDGAMDASNKPLENNEAIRKLLLRDKGLWTWLLGVLAETQEEQEEGNGDSGTA